MARICAVCSHKRLSAIDKAIVAGESMRAIERQYKVSKDSIRRHKAEHIPKTLAKAQEASEVARGDSLLDQLKTLQEQAQAIATKAEKAKNYSVALSGIREMRGIIELLAKLQGELQSAPTINMFVSAEWVSIQAVVVTALDPYPEAKKAVVDALEGVR
jgi:beta-phosphoglucomutase-like phosphatase (HAD superfamily)